MANNLPTEKKVMAVSMLCEGNSIRSIERITGIHRDTIMRLGCRVGDACYRIHNEKMQNIGSRQIEVDEIWGFIGKKRKNTQAGDARQGIGDVWTFIALDADTKLIPSYWVGQRTMLHANIFLKDLESRLKNRVQLSSDVKSGGPNAKIGGMSDALLREGGDYEFDLDWAQTEKFRSFVKQYLRDEHQAIIEITTDNKDPFAEF
jgi:hypothetical protein